MKRERDDEERYDLEEYSEPTRDDIFDQLEEEKELDEIKSKRGIEIKTQEIPVEWKRSKIVHEETLRFQLMTTEYFNEFNYEVGSRPILRLHGVNEHGNSVLVDVEDFMPYLYIAHDVKAIPNLDLFVEKLNAVAYILKPPKQMTQEQKENIAHLKAFVNEDVRHPELTMPKYPIIVKHLIEEVDAKSIWCHQFEGQKFIKLFTNIPASVPIVKSMLEKKGIETYESNLLFVLRFTIDKNLCGGGWIEVNNFTARDSTSKLSRSQIEVIVKCDDVKPLDPNSAEWSKNAPFRVLSFDIECGSRGIHFPKAKEGDPVVMISNKIKIFGTKDILVNNIFVIGGCDQISGTTIHSFETEKDLIEGWVDFFIANDPDIVTGYNFVKFDFPYLFERAEQLEISRFKELGRIYGSISKLKAITLESDQYGLKESFELPLSGVVQIDVMDCIKRDHKLDSYTLNYVSANFIGDQKVKLHHSFITKLANGSNADRANLGIYCSKDADLPLLLEDYLSLFVNIIELARVTGVPLDFIINRGQSVRTTTKLYNTAGKRGFKILNPIEKQSWDGKFGGAKVYEPKSGYYEDPVSTEDFESLYPTIMIAFNICYTTFIPKERLHLYKKEDYYTTPFGASFVKKEIIEGVLPQMLQDLLAARRIAKALLKNPNLTDAQKKVINGRQLAIKTICNSVYGYTGARFGPLPNVNISASVTAIGQEMIGITKTTIEEKFTKKNGYPFDAEVIYGDTDSVMVLMIGASIEDACKYGKEFASIVNAKFPKPINLQWEKVYMPYLLLSKKHYIGVKWENPIKPTEKLDAKGIETVKRDNCEFLKDSMKKTLGMIFKEKRKDEVPNYLKGQISKLLSGKIDISKLIITNSFGNSIEEYKTIPAAIHLAMRMAVRDPGTAPIVGDRIPWVFVRSIKNSKNKDSIEDPNYVSDHNIPLDYAKLLEKRIKEPLTRILKYIYDETTINSLWVGDHTRVRVGTKSDHGGPMMKFVVKKEVCLGCNVSLDSDEKGLCKFCKESGSMIMLNKIEERNERENLHCRFWSQCQDCQKTKYREINCSNGECPIYFARKSNHRELMKLETIISDLDALEW